MKNITKTLIFAGLIMGLGLAFASPTFAAAPIISNVNVTGITATSATLNATIDWQGDPTSAWFEISPSFNPVGQTNNITSIQTVSYNATGLTCGTNYTFNVGAINISGQVISTGNPFTTSPCPQPPTVVNAYAVNTTQTQTDLAGSVNPNGASTTVWFEYNANPICPTQNIGAGTSPVVVNPCTFTGLIPNQSYLVTLNAVNIKGTGLKTINFSTSSAPSATPPSISNVTATNIAQTSATLSAQINPNGSNSSGWFELAPNYTPAGQVNNINSTQTITYNLTGLTCNTSYNFNAGAVNIGGQVIQSSQFTTAGCGNSPTITTNPATGTTSSGTTLNGTWNANGFATTTWFEYGTSANPPFTNSTTPINQGTGSGGMAATLTGLSANTTYNFRACGQNSQGTNCGAVLSFTTNGQSSSGGGGGGNAPIITTTVATGISGTSAVLNGIWNSNGSTSSHVTSTWFQYGTSASNLNLSTSPVNKGLGSGVMAETLTGLTPNTVYYFRAVGANAYGTTQNASVLSFTISTGNQSGQPIISTTAATGISGTSATLNGIWNANGYSTNTWFEYGTSTSALNFSTNSVNQGLGSGVMAATLTGLSPNVTYYFRAVGQNANGTTYGTTLSFLTLAQSAPGAPQALTSIATEKTKSSAKLNALVVINPAASTEAWFEYGKTTNLGQSTAHQIIGSTGQIPFNQIVAGLEADTIYFFRAMAKNNYGTGAGNIMIFKTESASIAPPSPPGSGSSNSGSGNSSSASVGGEPILADNVTLLIESSETEVRGNSLIRYTITVKNKGANIVNAATLRVILPKGVEFSSASEGSANVDTLIANLGSLNSGAEKKVTVNGRVGKNVRAGDTLLATANLIFTGVSGKPSELIAFATVNVASLPLTAAAADTGAKTLGWFLIALGLILLIVIGREVYGRGQIRHFLAGLKINNTN